VSPTVKTLGTEVSVIANEDEALTKLGRAALSADEDPLYNEAARGKVSTTEVIHN
jgi:hypothetical protein